MLRIKLIKSKAGTRWQQNATVTALGLRKMNQVVEKDDNSSIRGMIHHVRHMVSVEVVEGEVAKKTKVVKKSGAAKKASKPAAKAVTAKVEPKVEAVATAQKPKAPAAPKKPAAKKPAAKKKDSKE